MKELALLTLILFVSCSKNNDDASSDVSNSEANSGNLQSNAPQFKQFPPIYYPEDNPFDEKVVALGDLLFNETMLSKDNTMSCASCHQAQFGLSDRDQFSTGVTGEQGNRHSMTLTNVAWGISFFWDGRAESLEAQALGPVTNPIEMNETWPNVVSKLQNDGEYPGLFEEAFGTSTISKELVAKAIAQYERTLISNNSKFDKYLKGELALTASEELGRNLFFSEKTECFHCHGGILFTDGVFHDNGLDEAYSDLGLYEVTKRDIDKGKFKTPTLRNVEYRSHYMHDGRFSTLEDVVEHYNSGVKASANLDDLIMIGGNLNLTAEEKTALVDFMKTLSDPDFIQQHSN